MTLYRFEEAEPTIGNGTWVAPGAHVIGRVTLGADVGVWFGVTLRGDNEPIVVGDRTNLQENVVIHTDWDFPVTIGAGCTIGHKAMIHGCTIGDNTLIGMGATVLNGARIGSNCLIGAGALVTEGKEIPDGSLVVGMPAKVRRDLSAEEIEANRTSAANYAAKMAAFRDGLTIAR
jgi:carbonic anhydrase/acetyltransferase-like protein (isoleucine patch superfamily)